jgi:DNA repair exonuclease SbcCD ATPase subunit
MSLNYNKVKEKLESGSQWTAYSDLFMVLSFIFLLLYVVSSLRNGALSIQKHVEQQLLQHQNKDLKQQLKIYDALKEDYLQNQATQDEQKTYEELMDQLKLLQSQEAQSQRALQKKVEESKMKQGALNRYQQIVRNIINSNYLAKAKIKRKNQIITKKIEAIERKDQVLAQKEDIIKSQDSAMQERLAEIANLNKNIENKENKIKRSERSLKKINEALTKKNVNLSKLKRKFNRDSKKIRKEHESRLKKERLAFNRSLKKQKLSAKKRAKKEADFRKATKRREQDFQKQLNRLARNMNSAQKEIDKMNKEKVNLQSSISGLKNENRMLEAEKDNLGKSIAQLESDKSMLALAKSAAESEAAASAKQAADATKQAATSAKQAADAAKQAAAFKESAQKLEGKNVRLAKDLKQAKEKLEAKKKIIKQIAKNLKDSGVEANIDQGTGDVIISFGDEYFEMNKARLKPRMRNILNKFIPRYAKGLLSDPKMAKKVKSVEIVGFASPTYGGKYIDPKSLDPKDQAAVAYNLDLSFNRAKSIFKYIFDTNKLKYKEQKNLLPLVKVTGRSFLAEGIEGKGIKEGIDSKTFCKKFDCKKAQKVIIKFNLK